ncbi:hypothetical protein BG015_004143, partial [Linnemannia schmuckeri]
MAMAQVLDHLTTEGTTQGPTPGKGIISTNTTTPTMEITDSQDDSGTTGAAVVAAEGDVDDDDRSIHFVTSEPDTAANAATMTTATAEPPFEGDGADPSQAAALIPPQSTFDWLAYTVSLNYNRLTVLEAQVILLKARGQVDKNVYLHPEVVSFYEQVLEQENNGTLERKTWPGNNTHIDNSDGSDNSSGSSSDEVGAGGGTGVGSGGTGGDA